MPYVEPPRVHVGKPVWISPPGHPPLGPVIGEERPFPKQWTQEEILELLTESSVQEWNKWRELHLGVPINLSNVNLSNV